MAADWCPGSDGEGDFGERHRELRARLDLGGDVVVAAVKVLHERASGTDHPAERSCLMPRIGCSRDFSRPSSASMAMFGVLLHDVAGREQQVTAGFVAALR